MSADLQNDIVHNDVEALRRKLSSSTINAVDADGYTPLYFACMKLAATVGTVTALLQLGAAVDAIGGDGETPLYIAVFNHRHEVAELLLKDGADVNRVNGPNRETALHLAARLGHGAIVSLLVRGGADLNALNARQETPMYAAAKAGYHETVYLLASAGANASIANEDGRTPLYIASEREFKHVVVVLKASTNPQDLKHAKAEGDAILKNSPAPIMTSHDIVDRAQKDRAFGEQLRRRGSVPVAVPPNTAPMEVVEIKVPHPKPRTHDPITGQSFGPCRSLEEVGYDEAPPIPQELQNRPPATLPRIGGTSMVVTTEEGSRKPIRIDEIDGEPEMEFFAPPRKH